MNFYKEPLPNGYRFIRFGVGDKFGSGDNSLEGCKELESELNNLGVKTRIGQNEAGMWSVAILETPDEPVYAKLFCLTDRRTGEVLYQS